MEIKATRLIQAPIDRVFDVFSDITRIEERISGITKVDILSETKSGVGTRWRETRVMFGQEATEEMEISAFTLNRSYEVVAASRGAEYHSIYNFTEENGGTRVEMVFSGKALSFMAKLMSPLAALMSGATRKALEADMDELKAVCEQRS